MLSDKYRLGMVLFLASESIFFIVLILAYVFYRASTANVPSATPFDSLDVARTSFFTVCLWASSLTVWLAVRGHKRGATWPWRLWLLLTIILGAVFLYGEVTEYQDMLSKDVSPHRDVWSSSFYALTGFHGTHVFIGLILLSILFILALANTFKAGRNHVAVETISLYWHFVDIVWVFIFSIVYLWSLAGR